jgi:hypothetical protein
MCVNSDGAVVCLAVNSVVHAAPLACVVVLVVEKRIKNTFGFLPREPHQSSSPRGKSKIYTV